jgi:hypothetical protein
VFKGGEEIMVVSKCMKCGAEIPENASFCPGCGAPKAEVLQTYQPKQPQYVKQKIMNKNTSPFEGLFDMFFSKTAIILAIALGILLAWIGVIIYIFANNYSNIAGLLSSLGFAIMGLMLLGGGIWNKKIDTYARLAMVIIGGFLIANGVSILSSLSSLFII